MYQPRLSEALLGNAEARGRVIGWVREWVQRTPWEQPTKPEAAS